TAAASGAKESPASAPRSISRFRLGHEGHLGHGAGAPCVRWRTERRARNGYLPFRENTSIVELPYRGGVRARGAHDGIRRAFQRFHDRTGPALATRLRWVGLAAHR